MDSTDTIIKEFFPDKDLKSWQRKLIKWAVAEEEMARAMKGLSGQEGIEWVDAVVEKWQFRCEIHRSDFEHIPEEGPVIVIANHPTVMDGVAVVNTISAVRKDIKIVANNVLSVLFPATKSISISIQNMQGKMKPRQYKEMNDHLKKGGVLVIFPAGRLARLSLTGLRESAWHPGFVQLATRNNATLLPVHLKGKNSALYYILAKIWRPLSNLMVIRELLKHHKKSVKVRICPPVDVDKIDVTETASLAIDFRKHLLHAGVNKTAILPEKISPGRREDRTLLLEEIKQCEVLKKLSNGKTLLLYRRRSEAYSSIIRELGRLREISFRETGACSGKKRDNDRFDNEYYHVILWDQHDLEIAGSYRLITVGTQLKQHGSSGIYSATLFTYPQDFTPQLEKCIEVGRGFIQDKYRKSNALDALWKGIFYFSQRHPELTHLLGILSIPQSFPYQAQQIIVSFYQAYFSDEAQRCIPLVNYIVSDVERAGTFSGQHFEQDWKILNAKLRELACELPWPFKQAAKWYSPGGSKILGFTEDREFNSVGGLNLCEIKKLKKVYYSHYIQLP